MASKNKNHHFYPLIKMFTQYPSRREGCVVATILIPLVQAFNTLTTNRTNAMSKEKVTVSVPWPGCQSLLPKPLNLSHVPLCLIGSYITTWKQMLLRFLNKHVGSTDQFHRPQRKNTHHHYTAKTKP